MSDKPTPSEDLNQIIESAKRLGLELNQADALQWISAMASQQGSTDVTYDGKSGTFGHRISMLDFSSADLAHFRRIGKLVEFHDEPGIVETALAISGSAAQSKIQSFPGDADFFERVNIKADTEKGAKQILSRIMRQKAISEKKGAEYQLIEVKFGSYPFECVKDGRPTKAGSPIAWRADEVTAGKLDVFRPDGSPAEILWEDVAENPGWCKLDWVVADPVRKQLVNASNMLDVTWEAPDGAIIPLDNYLDPYFQEVYLDAESIPLFSKLAKNVSGDALDEYVTQLEHEVEKYLTKDLNYGKAAKRMYNIFRLTGRYQEAAFLRELFDEPTTVLYQVWSVIRTIDDCFKPGSSIPLESLLAQTDDLILTVSKYMEGEKEVEIVRLLLRLRDILSQENSGQLSGAAEAARAEVINIVNNFFYQKLTGVASIKDYITNKTQK